MRKARATWALCLGLVLGASPCLSEPYVPRGEGGKPLPRCRVEWERRGIDPKRALYEPKREAAYFERASSDYGEWVKRLGRSGCWKDWTVVVYMAADNDLSRYSWRDLFEMEQVGSTMDADVVVFQDDAQVAGMRYYHVAKRPAFGFRQYSEAVKKFAEENGLGAQGLQAQEAEYLKAKGPELPVSPLVRVLPEGDSGDTRTAGEFLRFALAQYPSRRVLLVGWSHGEGFDAPAIRGKNRVSRKGGFAFDFSSGSHMTLPDMVGRKDGAGIRAILAKYRGGKSLDIAGSDACLNQQVEFALEWQGAVDYVYGTAGLLQGKGFNYGPFLRNLSYRTDYPTVQRLFLQDAERAADGKGMGTRLPDHVAELDRLLLSEKDPARRAALSLEKREAEPWLSRHEELSELAKDPDGAAELERRYLVEDTRAFALHVPALYGRSVSQDKQDLRLSYYDPDASMAVWDMARIQSVRLALDDLGKALLHWILYPKDVRDRNERRWALLDDVLKRVRRYGNISQDLYHLRLELGAWVALRSEEVDPRGFARKALERIESELASLKRALEEAVPAKFLGRNFISQKGLVPWRLSHGVAVWLPGTADEFEAEYAKFRSHSALYRSGDGPSHWATLVEALYAPDETLEKMKDPLFGR